MSHAHKRRQMKAVVASRAAAALAAPYEKSLSEWQGDLAHLRVLKSGAGFSEDEHLRARIKLGELLATVQRRRVEFTLAMQDHPLTGALGDIERSLSRLTEDLRNELRR